MATTKSRGRNKQIQQFLPTSLQSEILRALSHPTGFYQIYKKCELSIAEEAERHHICDQWRVLWGELDALKGAGLIEYNFPLWRKKV